MQYIVKNNIDKTYWARLMENTTDINQAHPHDLCSFISCITEAVDLSLIFVGSNRFYSEGGYREVL